MHPETYVSEQNTTLDKILSLIEDVIREISRSLARALEGLHSLHEILSQVIKGVSQVFRNFSM